MNSSLFQFQIISIHSLKTELSERNILSNFEKFYGCRIFFLVDDKDVDLEEIVVDQISFHSEIKWNEYQIMKLQYRMNMFVAYDNNRCN